MAFNDQSNQSKLVKGGYQGGQKPPFNQKKFPEQVLKEFIGRRVVLQMGKGRGPSIIEGRLVSINGSWLRLTDAIIRGRNMTAEPPVLVVNVYHVAHAHEPCKVTEHPVSVA